MVRRNSKGKVRGKKEFLPSEPLFIPFLQGSTEGLRSQQNSELQKYFSYCLHYGFGIQKSLAENIRPWNRQVSRNVYHGNSNTSYFLKWITQANYLHHIIYHREINKEDTNLKNMDLT